ncbi:MAG TPA: branched-chain amino acid ABC transporter substrate-binding protein, partial [Byssovorax sp.]
MMRRRGWVVGMAGALLVAAFGCGGGTDAKPEAGSAASAAEWKVGAYLSLSGEDTAFGVDTKEGIELAI